MIHCNNSVIIIALISCFNSKHNISLHLRVLEMFWNNCGHDCWLHFLRIYAIERIEKEKKLKKLFCFTI